MKDYRQQSRFGITLMLLVAVLLAGCAGPAATPTQPAKILKVGLLSPGTVHDGGWNELAYQSIKLIEKELGAKVSYVEISDSPSDIEKAFRDYANQGYDMIIGHSYVHQDAAEIVAKEYPKTVFLTSGGEKVGPNYAPVIFKENEVMYLLGVVAAHMTKTGKAVGIGGEEFPAISLPSDGFKAGFESVKGNQYTITYINSWDDITVGKEATLAGVAAGADIVVPNANIAGQGAFQAAEEKGIWAFGTNTDQSSLSPKTILASTVFNYAEEYLEIAKTIQDGSFKGGHVFAVGLDNPKAAYVAFNPTLKDKIPADVLTLVETTRQDIVSGKIVVPGNMIP
jgi:basic membrane protein A and related proteins